MKQLIKQLPLFETALFLLVLIPHLFIAFHSTTTILDWFQTDDAFYYFVTAGNIAEGNGITFDGITRTNGFQPLWMLVSIPIFALAQFDRILPLRIMVVVLAVLHAGTGIILLRYLKKFLRPEIASLASLYWVLSPYIHSITVKGGMESGINSFFILLFWYQLSDFINQSPLEKNAVKKIFGIGILAALTLFSRLDNIFLVLFGGIWLVLINLKNINALNKDLKSNWFQGFRTGITYFLTISGSLLAYMVWNRISFGTFVPISGLIKTWWGKLPYTVYGSVGFDAGRKAAIINHFFSGDRNWGPWSYIMKPINMWAESVSLKFQDLPISLERGTWIYIILLAIIILSAIILWISNKSAQFSVFGFGLIPIFLSTFFQIGYYNLGVSLGQRYWYWVVEIVLIVIFSGVLISQFLNTDLFTFKQKFLKQWNLGFQLIILIIGVNLFMNNIEYLKWALSDTNNIDEHTYMHKAKWIENNTEPNSLIASPGSGSLSYFTNDRTIINMDGLMNSVEYFRYLQAGEGDVYLDIIGVDYIFGNTALVAESWPYNQMLEGKLEEVSIYNYQAQKILLWRFVP